MIAKKIYESPDIIALPNLTYNKYGDPVGENEWSPEFGDDNSYAFWLEDELIISGERGSHTNNARANRLSYSGRIWTDKKMISFWDYPDRNTFMNIIYGLQDHFQIDILDDPEWKVEILPTYKEKWRPDMYVRDENQDEVEFETELIPVKDYQGSQQRSEIERKRSHLKSPIEKLEKPKKVFGGSKKYGREKPLPYRYKMVPESLKEIKWKKF